MGAGGLALLYLVGWWVLNNLLVTFTLIRNLPEWQHHRG
jgi:uncharacterized membrane protein YhdT